MNREQKKVYNKNYRLTHKEHIKQLKRDYRINNREKVRAYEKNYKETHREQIRLYREKNRLQIKLRNHEYYLKNKERILLRCKIFDSIHHEKRILRNRINNTKRERDLDFIPINDKFNESEAHHLDNKYVMYIPKEIHKRFGGYDRDLHRLLVLNELYKQDIIL